MSVIQATISSVPFIPLLRGRFAVAAITSLSLILFFYAFFMSLYLGHNLLVFILILLCIIIDSVACSIGDEIEFPLMILCVEMTARLRLSILSILPYFGEKSLPEPITGFFALLFIMSLHFDAMMPRIVAKVRGSYGEARTPGILNETDRRRRSRRASLRPIPIGFLEVGLAGAVIGPWSGFPLVGFAIAILLATAALAGNLAVARMGMRASVTL